MHLRYTPELYMQFYKCNTCVGYTLNTCVSHVYYMYSTNILELYEVHI